MDLFARAADVKFVISSSWRRDSLEASKHVVNALTWAGFTEPDRIIGVTPRIDGHRSREIAAWLEENEVEKFLILDDEAFDIKDLYPDELIKTDGVIGFAVTDYVKCMRYFGVGDKI